MKKIFSFLAVFLIFISFFAGVALAKKENKNDIPEIDGVYNDPDHPGIKVRVFVHRGKPDKPGQPTPPPPVWQCGLEDPNSTATVSAEVWKLSSSWTYNLNPASVPASVGGENLGKIAQDGFVEWKAPTGINFIKGPNTTIDRQGYDGQNIITWGRISASALGVTYIRYYLNTGEVVDVDTILNKKYSWMWFDSNTCAYLDYYDAENILTHELGHWVGLDDEYTGDFVDNTMYGYGAKGEVKKDTLTAGDSQAASGIYR